MDTSRLVSLSLVCSLTWWAPVWYAARPVREWLVPSIKREKAIYMVHKLKSEEISQEKNKGGSDGKLACKQAETVLDIDSSVKKALSITFTWCSAVFTDPSLSEVKGLLSWSGLFMWSLFCDRLESSFNLAWISHVIKPTGSNNHCNGTIIIFWSVISLEDVLWCRGSPPGCADRVSPSNTTGSIQEAKGWWRMMNP